MPAHFGARSAVVNEATLTGESVPQMKDQIGDEDRPLTATFKTGVLFSGTTLVSATGRPRDGSSAASADRLTPICLPLPSAAGVGFKLASSPSVRRLAWYGERRDTLACAIPEALH